MTVQDVFEAVGKFSGGQIDEAELKEIECVACPSARECSNGKVCYFSFLVSWSIGLSDIVWLTGISS